MPWWGLMLWGIGGVLSIEALDWVAAYERTGGYPWEQKTEPRLGPFVLSVFFRLAIGAFVTAGFAYPGQLTSVPAAIGVGIAAPVILEKLGRTAKSFGSPMAPGTEGR